MLWHKTKLCGYSVQNERCLNKLHFTYSVLLWSNETFSLPTTLSREEKKFAKLQKYSTLTHWLSALPEKYEVSTFCVLATLSKMSKLKISAYNSFEVPTFPCSKDISKCPKLNPINLLCCRDLVIQHFTQQKC